MTQMAGKKAHSQKFLAKRRLLRHANASDDFA
jgi:hypothetical protein